LLLVAEYFYASTTTVQLSSGDIVFIACVRRSMILFRDICDVCIDEFPPPNFCPSSVLAQRWTG